MKVFRLHADANNYEGILCVDEKDSAIFEAFDGNPKQSRWHSPAMRISGAEIPGRKKEKELPRGDFPGTYVSFAPAFSRRAIEELGPLLTDSGELLPLDCPDRDYYAYNVTRIVDALDEEQSTVKRFSDDGRIFRIVEHCFRPDRLIGVHVFKITQMRRSNIYVDDAFVERVRAARLKGFLFDLVWESNENQ